MLVECPDCHISFNPEMGVCPRCRAFRPSATECEDFLRVRVRRGIEGVVKEDELLRMLHDKGVATESAVEIIREERRRSKRGARHRARQRIVVGILLLFGGPFCLLVGYFNSPQGGRAEGSAMLGSDN
jgi:hypothetical protein